MHRAGEGRGLATGVGHGVDQLVVTDLIGVHGALDLDLVGQIAVDVVGGGDARHRIELGTDGDGRRLVHTANHGNDVVGGGDLEHGGGQCASGVCGALADGDALDIIVAVHGAVGGEHLVLAGLDAIDGGGIVVGVEDHHVGAAGVLRLIGHDTVGGLEHGHAGVDVIVAGLAEGSDPVAQLDQAPDVVDGAGVLRGAIPVDGVHLVTGVIAVVVAALGAQELLAQLDGRDAFGQVDHGIGELGARLGGGLVIRGHGLPELVVQGHVVVDLGVVHHLTGIRVVVLRIAVPAGGDGVGVVLAAEHVVGDEAFLIGLAGDETGVGVGEHGTLEAVADRVVEERDAVVGAVRSDLVGVWLDGHLALVHRGVHVPAFAEHDDGRIDLVEGSTNLLHRLGVDQTHEVESEAVDVVVLRPVGHRVDDVLAHHRTFGGGVVAATGVVDERTVVVIAEVVARDRLVERMVRGIVDVVVHHIHDDADVVLVQALDHLLHFGDAGARVARIGGVRAFRHVVVLRVVAPVLRAIGVVAQVAGLVDGTVVVHRHDLHVGDAQRLEIVEAGGRALGGLRAGFDHAQVLALLVGGDAGGRVDGEVADVHLGDGGVGGLAEGRHALARLAHGLLGEHYGALTVGDGRGGVRIGRGVHRAVGEGEPVGVRGAGGKLLHRGAPHALAFTGHVDGLIDLGIRVGGLVGDELDLGGGRRPHLEAGLLLGEGRAQILAAVGVLPVEGVGADHRTGDGVLGAEALDLDGVLAANVQILVGGDDHLGAVGLETLDIDGFAVGVRDGDLAFQVIRGDLLGKLGGQLVGAGDLGGLHGRAEGRAGGIHRGVAAEQPHFGRGVAVGVEHERVGRDPVIGVVRVLGLPRVLTVTAQHADIGSAVVVVVGVVGEGVLRDLAPIVMGGEGSGTAVPIGCPGPDIPLRHSGAGVLGVVVQAVVSVVVHLHLDGVGLAGVIGRCRIKRLDSGRLALVRVLGAVDPHLGGAVGAHGGATVGAVLVPIAGGDEEAELVVLAVEIEHGDLAPAVSAGEGVMLGVHVAAVHIGAPHVHAAVVRGAGWLVVHDETGLGADGFGVADGCGLLAHANVGDADVGMVVAAVLRVLPTIGVLVVEHEVDRLALGVDGGGVVTLRVEGHVGFRLLPIVAEAVMDLRGLPLRVGGLVVDGDASVVGQGVILLLAHVGIGRIGGGGGCGVRGLGSTGIQGDGGVRRHRGLDLATLDGHGLGAVHGGVHVAVFAVGEGCRVGGVLVLLAVVDGDEALGSAGEGDVVAAVILPIGDLGAVDIVAEGDHAAGGGPALLAVPIGIVGGACLVHIHVGHGGRGRSGCTVVVDVPLVVGEQARGAVVVGQHERVGQLVLGAVLVGQRTLVAGGVPVGDEHVGVIGGEILAQAIAQPLEVGDLVLEGLVHLGFEAEFGHGAVLHVIARLDARGLGGVADDLLNPVDIVGVLADFLGELLLDGLHAVSVDVLDGIHAEAAHAGVPQRG